jgi:cation transport ATPase
MHTQTYRVKGMHCASCSSVIEKTFKKVDGVHSAEVNYGTEKAKVSFDPSKTSPHDLSEHIEPLGYSLDLPTGAEEMGMSESEHAAHLGLNQSKKEKLAEVADMRTKVLSAIPIAIFAGLVMGWDILAEYSAVRFKQVFYRCNFSRKLLFRYRRDDMVAQFVNTIFCLFHLVFFGHGVQTITPAPSNQGFDGAPFPIRNSVPKTGKNR